jgi:hypothetical protein
VLVIAQLKRHADHGNDYKLQALLKSIPVSVERLLDDTLMKAGQDKRLVASLQWALFSTRPLGVEEFHTAVVLSNEELHAGTMHWDNSVAKESIKTFILSASKGLLEIVYYDRIQFIHESIREYFLHTALERIDHSLDSNVSDVSHHRLALWYRKYLQLTKMTRAVRSSKHPYAYWSQAKVIFPLLQYTRAGTLNVLRKVDHLCNTSGTSGASFETVALHQTALKITDSSRNLIQAARLAKYDKALGDNTQKKNVIKSAVAKIRWQVGEKEDVVRFRAEVTAQTTSLSVLLGATTW